MEAAALALGHSYPVHLFLGVVHSGIHPVDEVFSDRYYPSCHFVAVSVVQGHLARLSDRILHSVHSHPSEVSVSAAAFVVVGAALSDRNRSSSHYPSVAVLSAVAVALVVEVSFPLYHRHKIPAVEDNSDSAARTHFLVHHHYSFCRSRRRSSVRSHYHNHYIRTRLVGTVRIAVVGIVVVVEEPGCKTVEDQVSVLLYHYTVVDSAGNCLDRVPLCPSIILFLC